MAISENIDSSIYALKVRLFSIKANLEFGNEYLKINSIDQSQLASLIQGQKDYERKVEDVIKNFEQFLNDENVGTNRKQIMSSRFLSESSELLNDSRNNSVLKKSASLERTT